ncbi:MAG TPA: hypothetical protein VHW09_25420 [Bryobacteraceae bacterium]|jgi:hypothetical protein|nr:hypothetical protein [Bryobacteraceae bacterium]
MANNKLSAFFSLLLVFASGIVVGAVGYRVYNTSTSHAANSSRPPNRKMPPEEFRRQLIEEMTREVHLDDDQAAKLKDIYQETANAFDQARDAHNAKLHVEGQAIHDQQVEKIKKMLRPDQIPLYDALRTRREAERKARHKDTRTQ